MRRRRATLRGAVICLGVLLCTVAVSFAYFTAAGTGSASAGVTALSVPGSPTATGGAGSATVIWTASTISGAVAATSYTIERYSSAGTDLGAASCNPVPASRGVPNAFGSFSCSDAPGVGTYEYKITAHYNASWTAITGYTGTVTVTKSATALAATAPATGSTGTAIAAGSISGVLSGATSGAAGTVTFTVFGPQATAPSTCTTGGTTVGTATVSGNGTYHPSAGYTPSTAGTYWWYASYNGDTNNAASNSTCGAGMSSTVIKNATALTATSPVTGTTGTAIAASTIGSALSGATSAAAGTVTFTVFGPQTTAPSTCTSGGTTIGTATVSGNGTYHPSAGYTPSSPGTYWFYASYNGDTNNGAANSTCGTGMASTAVKNTTAVTASSPTTGTSGTPISTSSIGSVLSGASAGAAGTITFTAFGPQTTAPSTCTSGGTTIGTATVSGNGTYHPSAAFTPSTAGTYWFYASYNGDTSNGAANSTCGLGMSSTAVKNAPGTTATAPATDTTSTAIATTSISSLLSGATSTATGTITFKVFGPQTTAPTTCTTGGTTVGTATVTGNGTYHPSAGYTPSSPGTYWWYASYNGDTNNAASNSTCGAGMSATTVWSGTSAASASATTGTSATTSTFTVAANTTYVLVVFRHSSASDSITSISSTGLTPALSTSSFSLITSQTFSSSYYQWAYSVTTGASASGTGTLTVNFRNTLSSGITLVDLAQIAGNSLTTPVVAATVGKANGTGTTATANLSAAPAAQDAELVFLGAGANLGFTAPGAAGLTNVFYSHATAGSAATYGGIPAQQNSSFTIPTATWGTIALELGHS
jgi:hypothetical protein